MKKSITTRALCVVLAFLLLLCPMVQAEEAQTPDVKTTESSTVIKALRNYIHRMYQFEITDEDLLMALVQQIFEKDSSDETFEFVADAVMSALDQHSVYFTPAETKEFDEYVSAEFGGVGVSMSTIDGYCTIMSILPNTPADGSGLVPGDKIIAVNGESIVNLDIDLITSRIKGEIGTPVVLTILSENGETKDYTFVRNTVITPSAEYKLNKAGDTAHIIISQFAADTANQFHQILTEVKQKGVSKIIIDLRNNTGGYTDQAQLMASEFLGKDTVIYREHSRAYNLDRPYVSRNETPDTTTQIVILVNDYSASASEIFTGAMKDNGRAKVIGIKTFGKGTMQTVTSMGDYGSVKLTIGEFVSPNGNTINGVGIMPDIYVENTMRPVTDADLKPLSLSAKYKLGDENEEICAIKQRLSYIGLYSGDTESPVFDKALDLAVRRFQQSFDLYPYGVADINTQLTLQTCVKSGEIRVDNQLERAFRELGTEK